MHVTIRLFALQRQQLGRRELPLQLPEGATIAEAWTALEAAYPALAAASASMRFARNGVYADPAERLAEADELALIPPVAGGDRADEPANADASHADPATADPATADSGIRLVELGPEPIDGGMIARLRAAVATEADGAIVTFEGRTRVTPGTPAPGQEDEARRFAGQRVVGLDYEAYDAMARTVLIAIADEIGARWGVHRLAIRHRTGPVAATETSVVIVAAAAHRAEAFEAARYAIEELKARAPIWKSERFADGSVWLGAPARMGPADTAASSRSSDASKEGRS